MISGKFHLTAPDIADATLSIKMSLGEWKQVRESLSKANKWPETRLASIITDLIIQGEKVFYANDEEALK